MRARRRASRSWWAGTTAALLVALTACTPSSPDRPTTPGAPTSTPTVDRLDPPLDLGPGPQDPGDGSSVTDGTSPIMWPDGSPVELVPLDTGSARRLDLADVRTVSRHEADAGAAVDLVALSADGTLLVADTVTTGEDVITSVRTSRLRFEGPDGAHDVDPGDDISQYYGAWPLIDGSVVAYRYREAESADAELVRLRPGAHRAEVLDQGDRRVLGTGLLADDGTLTTWDGDVRTTGARSGSGTRDLVAARCGDVECFWSIEGDDEADPLLSVVEHGELVRAVGNSRETVARLSPSASIVGAFDDTVVLQLNALDRFGWTLVVLDVAARTAWAVHEVGDMAVAGGRVAWTGIDPVEWFGTETGVAPADIHVRDIARGDLVRIVVPESAYRVLLGGPYVAWAVRERGAEKLAARSVVVEVPDARLAD
ncbi:hypothetical protein [Sanguibacter massiliensis]|uniref:hypothetical protein n=1 Tax=Sanguibacter massiliensis TaxID=1973217 RepID=UPI000C856C40|nr:hypothetical protein [Sanguibacter massiliensis]